MRMQNITSFICTLLCQHFSTDVVLPVGDISLLVYDSAIIAHHFELYRALRCSL